jgi:membrane associated rhomboid family serine protease
LYAAGRFSAEGFLAGEWWRLFTGAFLHSGVDHVLSNSAALLLAGLILEPRIGTLRTMLVFIAGDLAGSAATLVIHRHSSGASDAIMALVGALLARPPRRWDNPYAIVAGAVSLYLAWLTYRVISSGADSMEIGHEAHVAGLIMGLCLGALLNDQSPPIATSWPRPLRIAAVSCAVVGLILGQARLTRWNLGWRRGAAIRAERRGDFVAAKELWATVEKAADPNSGVDAVFIENAAKFRVRTHDFVGARDLLITVAPTLDQANVFRDVGFLLAQHAPTDQHLALRYLRKAASLDSNRADVLNAIAWSIVSSDSELAIGQKEEALRLARRAVALDRRQIPEFMATLAWAEFGYGNTTSAIGWMRRAIARNPSNRAAFEADLALLEQE